MEEPKRVRINEYGHLVAIVGTHWTIMEIAQWVLEKFIDPATGDGSAYAAANTWLMGMIGFDHVNWFQSKQDDATLFCQLWYVDPYNPVLPDSLSSFLICYSGYDSIEISIWNKGEAKVV